MIGITHEIELIDYSVICESSSYIKGALVLGAYENQIDTLHITANDLWENLTVSVAFSAGPLYKKVHMDHNGMVSIPACVMRHHIPPNRLGKIIFSGTAPNVRRIVVELPLSARVKSYTCGSFRLICPLANFQC